MTVDAATTPRLGGQISAARRARNMTANMWMIGAVLIALVPLLLLVAQVVSKGWDVVTTDFPKFLTDPIPTISFLAGGGVGPAIVGTALITGAAALMAIPLGVLGAIYLNEYGKTGRIGNALRFFSQVMSGVPSIVMGLFVFTLYTLNRPDGDKLVGFGGSLALACLMLPIVIRSAEEMLALVPDELRQASLALGAPQWRTIVSVVLPAAAPGIISGAMLAIARAAGETAPLLFTIGVTSSTNLNLFHGTNTALPYQIWDNAKQVAAPAQARAWGAALTLIVIVMLCSLAARFIASRFTKIEVH